MNYDVTIYVRVEKKGQPHVYLLPRGKVSILLYDGFSHVPRHKYKHLFNFLPYFFFPLGETGAAGFCDLHLDI